MRKPSKRDLLLAAEVVEHAWALWQLYGCDRDPGLRAVREAVEQRTREFNQQSWGRLFRRGSDGEWHRSRGIAAMAADGERYRLERRGRREMMLALHRHLWGNT